MQPTSAICFVESAHICCISHCMPNSPLVSSAQRLSGMYWNNCVMEWRNRVYLICPRRLFRAGSYNAARFTARSRRCIMSASDMGVSLITPPPTQSSIYNICFSMSKYMKCCAWRLCLCFRHNFPTVANQKAMIFFSSDAIFILDLDNYTEQSLYWA